MNTLTQSGVFREASPLLLEELRAKNIGEKITFLLPTKYISEEASKVGYLLNELLNKRVEHKSIYRTFLASSHWEAISGTVKIMRHNRPGQTDKTILIFDPTRQLAQVFQPLLVKERKKLVPNLQFENDFEKVKELLDQPNAFFGFICSWNKSISIDEVDALFKFCKNQNILTALDEAELENWYEERTDHVFSTPPDVFILGESLTGREVPFGSFSMRAEIHAPWNSIDSCLTHSSSYTGNTLALSMIYAQLKKYGLTGSEEFITNNRKQKYWAYSRYINPAIGWIFYVTGLSPEVVRAKGSRLQLNIKGKVEEVIDGIAGSGCCLRGHNPSDLITEVLDKHDQKEDYWKKLSYKFSELSGLPHVFPAVSGSTAVDIAIILSLLGNHPRTKLVTFRNNYSGKSLISLNLTRFDFFRAPFHPLYFDVVEIDAFKENAAQELEAELTSGTVSLVWFEILQGQNLDRIPDAIIDVINRNQEKGGYFVGVDEILTGMFRTGPFICSAGKVLKPDVIALAKGVSDMSFPMASVLVSERLYKLAKKENSSLVEMLETHFINQLGSHIALHGLEKALETGLDHHVEEMGNLFKSLVKESVSTSPLHKEVRGEGLLLYLKLNKKAFPINVIGEEFVEFLMSDFYLNKGKVLFLNSRLTPSLSISRKDVESLSERVKKIIRITNVYSLFFFSLKQIIHIYTLCWLQKIREKFGKNRS